MSTEIKTHWKKLHNPDYIGAYAFQPGEEKILTIASVTQEDVKNKDGKTDTVMTVRFKEKDVKPLICNVTNAKAIEKVAGSGYIEDWTGVPIQLYVTEVSAFGATVDAVRVRPKRPKLSLPALPESGPKYDKVVERLASGEATIEAVRMHFTVSDELAAQLMTDAMHKAPVQGGSDA
jgi:hypothetical protein